MLALIQEALRISPEFKAKYLYWIQQRRRAPSNEWFFNELVKVFGLERVKAEFDKIIKDENKA